MEPISYRDPALWESSPGNTHSSKDAVEGGPLGMDDEASNTIVFNPIKKGFLDISDISKSKSVPGTEPDSGRKV